MLLLRLISISSMTRISLKIPHLHLTPILSLANVETLYSRLHSSALQYPPGEKGLTLIVSAGDDISREILFPDLC